MLLECLVFFFVILLYLPLFLHLLIAWVFYALERIACNNQWGSICVDKSLPRMSSDNSIGWKWWCKSSSNRRFIFHPRSGWTHKVDWWPHHGELVDEAKPLEYPGESSKRWRSRDKPDQIDNLVAKESTERSRCGRHTLGSITVSSRSSDGRRWRYSKMSLRTRFTQWKHMT